MSFLFGSSPKMPPLPEPPPILPMPAVDAPTGELEKAEEKIAKKKGVSSTILAGLLPEQAPVTSPHLLGGGKKKETA